MATITVNGETRRMVRLPLTDAEKDIIFDDIDTDKSGTLDMTEFTIYILGKYNITRETAVNIFKSNDIDGNNTIDKVEFRVLLKKIDVVNIEIDTENQTQLLNSVACIARWSSCGCFFCLCTLGASCCISTKCAASEGAKMAEYADNAEKGREARLVKALTMENRAVGNQL